MERLRSLIDGDELTIAPVALNPLMARMAVEAGFKAIYMSGGSLGWVKCNTEATITLPEMVDIAIDMRSVSDVPIVLDAGGGWGDPAHIHRTIKRRPAPAAPVSSPCRCRTSGSGRFHGIQDRRSGGGAA